MCDPKSVYSGVQARARTTVHTGKLWRVVEKVDELQKLNGTNAKPGAELNGLEFAKLIGEVPGAELKGIALQN